MPSPAATVIGTTATDYPNVEVFNKIPYAQPPIGNLRLRPPQSNANTSLGTLNATESAPTCPQFFLQVDTSDFPTGVLGELINIPFFQNSVLDASEDCLTVDVRRPVGTTASDKLPVLFWIFGGAYALGSTAMYDFSSIVSQSINTSKPIMSVAVNYRVGGFGFMPGSAIKADGSSNLGLLDQRMGLQWVQDNVAAFGGDPTKVTIWGESAGALSVWNQMVLYDGDNTYKGQPLFRGAIMDSGSISPTEPIDGPKGQQTYNMVIKAAGCDTATDTLSCLRGLSYTDYLDAVNSVPSFLGYTAPTLQYQPRPDGKSLTASPHVLLAEGKYTKVPMIIGDQEDEGTLFSLFTNNITTSEELVSYWNSVVWQQANASTVQSFIDTYPDNASDGSPFRTSVLNNWYPQYKRFAAIMGDTTFTLARRLVLDTTSTLNPSVPSWSYLSSYLHYAPILGTLHGSDLIYVVFGTFDNYARNSIRDYYYNFVHNLDPNADLDPNINMQWPQWSQNKTLLWYSSADKSETLADDFRSAQYASYKANVDQLIV